jgi:hypothetical protein
VRPRGSVLARQVDVGLRDLRGQPQTIMLVTSGFPELFWSQHFSQSAGRIRGIIDRNVGDVVTAKLAQQMGQQTSRVHGKSPSISIDWTNQLAGMDALREADREVGRASTAPGFGEFL